MHDGYDMPDTFEGTGGPTGAGWDDRFHFRTSDGSAPAGLLTGGGPSLPPDRLIEAMAQLAEDAYDQTARDAIAEGWHAYTAVELGMAKKGSGSVRYTFKDGVYQGDTARSSEGQALVLSQTVGDETILTLAFRGTVDLAKQFADYFPFDKHYENFKPLIEAVKDYVADASNGIDKVVVTGHSLGGAMAQLFMNESVAVPVSGYTFGSPGADKAARDAKLLNIAHTNDVIPALGGIKDDRSGGVVTVDKNGLTGLKAAHAIETYMKTTAFLTEQALDDDGPFHETKLADAFRTGGNYLRDIRLEIGSNRDDVLRPFAEDRFVLAGDGDDRFEIRRGELLPHQRRDFDGGSGDDSVMLPYNRKRKGDGVIFQLAERDDGGTALKYDVASGAKDKWKAVGVFYRTETVVYKNGKTEAFAELAVKTVTAHEGDLIAA